jgi:hypothetical protein
MHGQIATWSELKEAMLMLDVNVYLTLIKEILLQVMVAVIDDEPHAGSMIGEYFTRVMNPCKVNLATRERLIDPAMEMTVCTITDLGGNVVFTGMDATFRWIEGFLVYDGRKYEWGEQA